MAYRFSRRAALAGALSTALLLPGAAALAAGDDQHGHATRTSNAPAKAKGQAASAATGHAVALGKPAALAAATRTVEVDMDDNMRFTPDRIAIKQGETIRFVVRNRGKLKHEMVLGTQAELKQHAALMAKFPEMEHDDPNAVSVDPGKTGEFAWKFTKAGSFHFACLVPGHYEAGMRGRTRVSK